MEWCCGPVFIRGEDHLLQTGHEVSGHKHNFDHITYFAKGKWEIWLHRDDVEVAHRIIDHDPMPMLIPKDCMHRFKLLEGPGVYHCIFPHRDNVTQDVVPEYNGWLEAYH